MSSNAVSQQEQDKNKALTLKMIGIITLGAALGAPAVGWFLYQVKELSWGAGGGAYDLVQLPEKAAVKAKDRAFYCTDSTSKKYIGCN